MKTVAWRISQREPDTGFTLIELLIVITIMPLIAGAIAAGFITTLQNKDMTTSRLVDSHDAQITSTYFVRDVKNAQYVATSSSPVCGLSTYLLGLSWSAASPSGTVVTHYAAYTLDSTHKTLSRTSCTSGANQALPVSHDAGAATVTVTCTDGSTTCAASGLIAATPKTKVAVGIDHIQITVTEPLSNYTFNVTASPQGWVAAAADQGGGNPTTPPLFLMNTPSVNADGNCNTTVHGIAAVNTSQNGLLPGTRNFVADEIYSQATDPQSSGSTPEVVGPPLADPYANLVPPSQGDPNVTYVDGTFSPNGQLNGIYILNNGLTMSGQNSISTGPDGVLLYVLHGNVDLTGGSDVVLDNPYSKYSPLSIWLAQGDNGTVSLGGNSGATTINGTIYAPSGGVSAGGTSGITAGGIVARTLDCHGTSNIGVGPIPTTTTLSASPASPSADGQALHLTATTVQAPNGIVDSGNVVFDVVDKNGTDTSDCAVAAPVDRSGVATCDTGPLSRALAPYRITAFYQGDSSFDGSTSNALTQRVLEPTTTTLAATPNLKTGSSATITASVAAADGSSPTGTVTFSDVTCSGGNTKSLSSGTATCSIGTVFASQSPYAMTATYAESASPVTWLGSTKQLSVPVSLAPTITSVVSSKPSSKPSAQVVFTATVAPTPSSGTVTWSFTAQSGAAPTCTSTTALTTGVATCTVKGGTFTSTGSPYRVTATYSGNTDYSGSNGTMTQLVASVGSTTAFVSLTHGNGGSIRKYTDHVKVTGSDGGIPTGQVFFYLCLNATTGCTPTTPGATQSSGTLDGTGAAASPATATLTQGRQYCFGAVYQGDTDYLSSSDTTADQCFTA